MINSDYIKHSLLLLIILFIFSFTSLKAQNSNELNTEDLYNAEFFDYIYRGHFENVELSREDVFFLNILNQYLNAYGRQCSGSLPVDKVKIMESVCATERVTKNGYGVEISRYCVEYRDQWTGLYARRDMYSAKLRLENMLIGNGLQKVVQSLSDPDFYGNSVDLAHKAKGLRMDLSRIFELNPCDSKALRQFEENLKRFALDNSPIRMEAKSRYAAMKESGGPTGTQDLNSLIDDLVSDQSKTWMLNRYKTGSISGTHILSTDQQGRPATVSANYLFSGFGGNKEGWVKVIFKEGLPECIYFWDFPNNCKTPGSSIVASYAQGSYSK